MFKVYNDHTADEKTSNEYSDDDLIYFNPVSTATNALNLSSLNKNNTNAYEEKQYKLYKPTVSLLVLLIKKLISIL